MRQRRESSGAMPLMPATTTVLRPRMMDHVHTADAQRLTPTYDGYEVIVEPYAVHTSGELTGMTTYRLYLETGHPDDLVTSFTGNGEWGLELNTTGCVLPETLLVDGLQLDKTQRLMEMFPNLMYDSYVTIQLDAPAGYVVDRE